RRPSRSRPRSDRYRAWRASKRRASERSATTTTGKPGTIAPSRPARRRWPGPSSPRTIGRDEGSTVYLHCSRKGRRNSRRPPAARIEAGQRHARAHEAVVTAQDVLRGDEAAFSYRGFGERHFERVVQPCGLPVFDVQTMDHENDAVFSLEGGQREPERCEPFGASAFQETKVIGVVHNPGGIGILVVNADWPAKGFRYTAHSLAKSWPAAAGGTMPKC